MDKQLSVSPYFMGRRKQSTLPCPLLNILIQSDEPGGKTDSILDTLFESDRYKHKNPIDHNLLVYRCSESSDNVDVAVFVVHPNTKERNKGEASLQEKVVKFIEKETPETKSKDRIPVVILFAYGTNEKFSDIEFNKNLMERHSTIDKIDLREETNRFIHFAFAKDDEISCKESLERIVSIGIVLSEKFDLTTFLEKSPEDVVQKVVKQDYQSNCGEKCDKNIAHLISKMDLPWTVHKLVNGFQKSVVLEMLEKQETRHNQTPLMIAAIDSNKAVLAAFMTFYASNVDLTEFRHRKCQSKKFNNVETLCVNYRDECNMCIINVLLHTNDIFENNLTSFIVTAPEKSLVAMGIVLQFEHDFHIRSNYELKQLKLEKDREEEKDLCYLKLQNCLQQNVGSSLHTDQVLDLMEETRNPSYTSIVVKIIIALLTVHLLEFGLHLGDQITDALVAKSYYYNETSDTTMQIDASQPLCPDWTQNNSTQIPLKYYPGKLNSWHRFLYTIFSMLLPSIFYGIEIWRNNAAWLFSYFRVHTCQMWAIICLAPAIFPILAIVWPLVLFVWRIHLLVKYEWAKGDKRLKFKHDFEEVSLIVLVVGLFEVSIESSMQAILQWYEIFPSFIGRLHEYLVCPEEITQTLSFETKSISFIFSIISLVWSFTSYSAAQKYGALDISRDMLARLMLFLSTFFLIFCRVNALILFMYYWGEGYFYPGVLLVFGHVVVTMLIHGFSLHHGGKLVLEKTSNYIKRKNSIKEGSHSKHTMLSYRMKFIMSVFYVCLLNGVANIFNNNFITIPMDTFKNLGKKKRKTFWRQLVGDLIFVTQNVFMTSLIFKIDAPPLNHPITAWSVWGIIISFQICGLILKVLYYKYFHIWRDMTVRVTVDGLKRGNETNLMSFKTRKKKDAIKRQTLETLFTGNKPLKENSKWQDVQELFRGGEGRENSHPNEDVQHEKSKVMGQGTLERATSLCASQTFEIKKIETAGDV